MHSTLQAATAANWAGAPALSRPGCRPVAHAVGAADLPQSAEQQPPNAILPRDIRLHLPATRWQSVGTKSANRRLKKLSGRQRRFQKATNHRISKQRVAKANDSHRALALEELTHMRQRPEQTVRKSQRACPSNWAFAPLRQFISDKAQMAGVAIMLVSAAASSQPWYQCG